MNKTILTISSYYFTTGWARFAGTGYFSVASDQDERHEWA